jgi:hypothetical protein
MTKIVFRMSVNEACEKILFCFYNISCDFLHFISLILRKGKCKQNFPL